MPEAAALPPVWDYVIIGSGFGGSVSALRLAEKGYSVLVLERGRRFEDHDFPRTTWEVSRYLWAPRLGCRGILEISAFRDIVAFHGAGVGGGSLGYANVLMQPDRHLFDSAEWNRPIAWRDALAPHYDTARRMLGVAANPRRTPADRILQDVAREFGAEGTFRSTDVGAFFGEPGREGVQVPDPYFGGDGPPRSGCTFCGGCMVGCRHGAKNTLVKNYLWLAERLGTRIEADTEVRDIRPLPAGEAGGARYQVVVTGSGWRNRARRAVRARQVILAAGAVGTMRLLFRCRDVTRSLARLSPRLGESVRTNNEALLGVINRSAEPDQSHGVAISSIAHVDPVTQVEPVRYPAGSSLMRFLTGPILPQAGTLRRVAAFLWETIRHPGLFYQTHIRSQWAERSTIILVMQTADSRLRFRGGRGLLTGFRRGLVSEPDPSSPPASPIALGHAIARAFARRSEGVPAASLGESLFGIPMTAHLLGGCPFGDSARDGVINLDGEVHGYPGLYVVDGSIVPGNPGVNPSLTITAMAEFLMSRRPPRAVA